MTWCITTCNFDIDVDLLFQENSTIGQKMWVCRINIWRIKTDWIEFWLMWLSVSFPFPSALTEKIVSVLPKMKCPHRLEPHQIQGLDFIHIFPVVQVCTPSYLSHLKELKTYITISLGSVWFYVFERSFFCSSRLHYLIKNTVKIVIVKCYYNLTTVFYFNIF